MEFRLIYIGIAVIYFLIAFIVEVSSIIMRLMIAISNLSILYIHTGHLSQLWISLVSKESEEPFIQIMYSQYKQRYLA